MVVLSYNHTEHHSMHSPFQHRPISCVTETLFHGGRCTVAETSPPFVCWRLHLPLPCVTRVYPYSFFSLLFINCVPTIQHECTMYLHHQVILTPPHAPHRYLSFYTTLFLTLVSFCLVVGPGYWMVNTWVKHGLFYVYCGSPDESEDISIICEYLSLSMYICVLFVGSHQAMSPPPLRLLPLLQPP